MKKILFAAALLTFMMASCTPQQDDESPAANVTSEQLSKEVQITAKKEGNNNLTVTTSPTRYIYVYDAETNEMVGSGTSVKVQVLPPARTVKYYVQVTGFDRSVAKSEPKAIDVKEFTDLDPILTTLFGDGKGGFTSYTYTWNEAAPEGVWGNGGYMESTGPDWWKVQASEINTQAKDKGLEKDGLDGWFSMGLGAGGVKTSRGETGSVSATSTKVKDGWDIGTLTFTGTIPLLGVLTNQGNARQYVYQVLKADGKELRLCAPEPGAGDWGAAWFWNFKKK
uniref:Lipoprotein n=5 Tax=unclassified Prevotella TaxID=2638335 RepID=A0AB33JIE3_9BACT